MTWLKALLKALVLPPTGPLLLAAAGLWMIGGIPRAGRILAWTGILLLLALSTPPVAFRLLTLVDTSPPLDVQRARSAQAIVILGGGVRRHAAEYGGDTLGHLTLERVRYGAQVARVTGLPILVTGGSVFGGEPEAKLMRAALEREFRVPVRWAETRSRNTHENAVRSAEILVAEHISRIVLVAHSFDMPRAKAEFAAQGLEAIPAPTGIPSGEFDTPFDVLPSMAALQGSYFALYEILANIARWITINIGTPISKEQHAYFAVPSVTVFVVRRSARAMARTVNMDSLPQPVVYR
ncbi:MAG TPA: YdcF family protein [Casimicrobiaceae bacterium]|nr:YdcF family protein [Casimicrobiaceae bacterium]